jgi:hypothetical protein
MRWVVLGVLVLLAGGVGFYALSRGAIAPTLPEIGPGAHPVSGRARLSSIDAGTRQADASVR